ncbi:MAG: hypothetical protein ACXWNK_00470 [Vulcanimicrobiaceae bacterium]
MELRSSERRDRVWFYVIAIALFLISLSRGFEELTSPHVLLSHVLLRKLYSVIAFSIVGYMRARLVRIENLSDVLQTGGAVGLYSAGIEVVQRMLGSHEGRLWNLADTAMGILGGLIGGCLYLLISRVRRASSPKERVPITRAVSAVKD